MNKSIILPFFIILFITSILGGAIGGAFPFGGFFQSPIAHIQLPAEKIPGLGVFNTSLTLWIGMIILMTFVLLATRNMKNVPDGRLQNIAEVIVEFFVNLAQTISGSEKGRRFVPLVLSIFLCVVVSNWVGVLPGVGTVGIVESAEVVYSHKEHKVDSCHSSDHSSDHGSDHKDFNCKEALKEHLVVFESIPGTGIKYLPPGRGESKVEKGGGVVLVEDVIHSHSKLESKTYDQKHEKPLSSNLEGKYAGRLLPLLRGANTDLNTTLAIAIVAMVAVQFWGISALGIRKYGGKFFNFSSPIMLFVGLLEFIAELARVVSFTFRLFGNMFAGEVLLVAMMFLLPFIGIIPFMGLELFVGVIQAFIFSILTLIFGITAISDHSEH
ncbi:MAG: hypothetical protein CL762_01355 [Chloroflexi bacterium]|nr:hypothetical protein [Chloroflexota bacterium]